MVQTYETKSAIMFFKAKCNNQVTQVLLSRDDKLKQPECEITLQDVTKQRNAVKQRTKNVNMRLLDSLLFVSNERGHSSLQRISFQIK